MTIKNKIIAILLLSTITTASYAAKIDPISAPKDMFYRLGTTDSPETKYESNNQIDLSTPKFETKPVLVEDRRNENPTYADLSIKKMAMEVSSAIEMDYNDMQEDLSLLWQGAATNSDTIKFAIYKLANPEKDKPDTGTVKKVLTTIAGMSTFLGAGTGNPIMASAALIGGNTLGIMSQDDKALNYKYSQVNDADMIILVRKVDELQQKVVDKYYDYMTSRLRFDMTSKMVKEREENYRRAQKSSREVLLITDTFYREALDEQVKARGDFFEKRSQLEQLVGNDIFKQFEERVDERMFGKK
ncbi:hypothetical protein IKQ21_01355 [bacterium]|nr:hypothetical protein [bacterium]